MCLKHKKTNTKKLALAKTNTKLQNPGLVAFDDIQPWNGVGLFLQHWKSHGAINGQSSKYWIVNYSNYDTQ